MPRLTSGRWIFEFDSIRTYIDVISNKDRRMCLVNKREHLAERIEAYKLFSVTETGLRSAFQSAFDNVRLESTYIGGVELECDDPSGHFYGIAKEEDAYTLLRWRAAAFVPYPIIVLPVTMLDVRIKGKQLIASDDLQCLDAYLDGFMSRRLIVHDTPMNRNKSMCRVYSKLLNHASKVYGLSPAYRRHLMSLLDSEFTRLQEEVEG